MNDEYYWDADEQNTDDTDDTDEVQLKEFEQLYLGALATKAENNDPRHKEIGDRVIIWDCSYSFNIDTGHCADSRHWPPYEAGIVAETGSARVYNNQACDLLVIFSSGLRVGVPSKHVKRTDSCLL